MLTQEQRDKLKLAEGKVDIACGDNKKDGYFGVDLMQTASSDLVMNVLKFPWPFEDDSIEAIHCSHFIEHIPMAYVSPTGEYKLVPDEHDKDLLFAFFDECYRILKPGGVLTLIAPNARSNRGWQDATHRRFIVAETFLYTAQWWRENNKLSHYNVECNFLGDCNPMVSQELTLMHPEAAQRHMQYYWNTIADWQAVLTKHPKGFTPDTVIQQLAWQKVMEEQAKSKKG